MDLIKKAENLVNSFQYIEAKKLLDNLPNVDNERDLLIILNVKAFVYFSLNDFLVTSLICFSESTSPFAIA